MAAEYPVCKANLEMFGPKEVWEEIDRLIPDKIPDTERDSEHRRGWKTVRVFVSSTFKDFHYEREVLVKQVFPDLRKWCQNRKLHLVECDLRWGAPGHFNSEEKMKICLDEIKRCYDDNHQRPFFINMISKRVGWIPKPNEAKEKDRISFDLMRQFRLVFGLSITEMEIVYGAYSITNPNALFLLRDDSFFKTLPNDENLRENFDYDNKAKEKIPLLKTKLAGKFQQSKETQFWPYSAEFSRFSAGDEENKKVILRLHNEKDFCDKILQFFQEKVGLMYPPFKEVEDPFVARKLDHEAFMWAKAQDVLGREDVLSKISQYLKGENGDVPLLLLGKPGIGKSSIMAKAAMDAEENKSKIAGGGSGGWRVFYHFVGAVPGSTELRILLHRILTEITDSNPTELPNDMEECVATTNSALNKDSCPRIILFIDALNQLDEDHTSVGLVNWLPKKLSDRVRCVFAMVPDCAQHKNLMAKESKPRELNVSDLSQTARMDLVKNYLIKYNKMLDKKQMNLMLTKKSAVNPLWLTVACEELRVHGNFRTVGDKIKQLADDLNGLLEQVLSRFELESAETSAELLKATLCLIEVSRRGLLETELIYILGGLYFSKTKGSSESCSKVHYSEEQRLPALQWAQVTRSMGTFLRPYGGLNEGRLDFYHRTVSKAVRNKYLQESKNNIGKLEWHKKLADFFQHCTLPLERRVEEYPYHLMCLEDGERLKTFLCAWDVFDVLYDREHSIQLLKYWEPCGGSETMAKTYKELLPNCPEDQKITKYEQVGRVCLQGGQHDYSLELAQSGLKLIQGSEDLMSLVGFYTLLCDIYGQQYMTTTVVDKKNLPIVQEALKYSEKSRDVLQKLRMQDSKHTKMYGQYLMRHAFNYSRLAEVKGDNTMTATEASDTGLTYIADAIKLFEELGETEMLVEALLTKGTLYRESNFGLEEKCLKEAMELCKDVYGDTHLLMPRILTNLGNAYADNNEDEKAFEAYVKCIQLYHQLFGPDHPRTKSVHKLVSYPHYRFKFGAVEMEGSNVYVVPLDRSERKLVE